MLYEPVIDTIQCLVYGVQVLGFGATDMLYELGVDDLCGDTHTAAPVHGPILLPCWSVPYAWIRRIGEISHGRADAPSVERATIGFRVLGPGWRVLQSRFWVMGFRALGF